MKLILAILLSTTTLFWAKGQNKVDTSSYAILRYDKSSTNIFGQDCSQADLSESEIIGLESLLAKCVEKYNTDRTRYFKKLIKKEPNVHYDKKDFIIELAKYKRQFIAITNSKGEKEVWVNCFRPDPLTLFNYWRKKIVRVLMEDITFLI